MTEKKTECKVPFELVERIASELDPRFGYNEFSLCFFSVDEHIFCEIDNYDEDLNPSGTIIYNVVVQSDSGMQFYEMNDDQAEEINKLRIAKKENWL